MDQEVVATAVALVVKVGISNVVKNVAEARAIVPVVINVLINQGAGC